MKLLRRHSIFPRGKVKRKLSVYPQRTSPARFMSDNSNAKPGTMAWLATKADFSYMNKLHCEPEYEKFAPNRASRQVFSGHYVPVKPTPLPKPYLVSYSPSMAHEIGLSDETCTSEDFVAFFSGDIDRVPGFKSWATPYALSIYGKEMYQNCPFGTGNGYGDGRAISVAEVVNDKGARWELQLKGGGRTPFCRGGDGRAVLRSSVREFLASEAMHNLGISTTRALSLIGSATERVNRPWYSGSQNDDAQIPSADDPRLKLYPEHLRPLLIEQLKMSLREPDTMQASTCAISCRTASSFLRVGQVELYGRRVRQKSGAAKKLAVEELEMIVEHVMFREYPQLSPHASTAISTSTSTPSSSSPSSTSSSTTAQQSSLPLQQRIVLLLEEMSQRIADLTANWIRVGYTQGNFNSDNCLVGGRTMDYGPFGFIEKFEYTWNMWLGGGEHFSFMNQPTAGTKNFQSFVSAVVPLLDTEWEEKAMAIAAKHEEVAINALNAVWSEKLGIPSEKWNIEGKQLIDTMLQLMEMTQADYSIVWRNLADMVEKYMSSSTISSIPDSDLLLFFHDAFYASLSDASTKAWGNFFRTFLSHVKSVNAEKSPAEVAAKMRLVSPKYVPREWMLVSAYTKADKGDYTILKELQKLFENPYGIISSEGASSNYFTKEYDKQMSEKYFRKAPKETYCGAGLGGTAYMT